MTRSDSVFYGDPVTKIFLSVNNFVGFVKPYVKYSMLVKSPDVGGNVVHIITL